MPAALQQMLIAGGKRQVLIDRTLGTNIGDMTGNGGLAAAFDGNANQGAIDCAVKSSDAFGYVGKTLAAPSVFAKATVHGSNNQGFINIVGRGVTLTMRGKQGAAPSTALDGTSIGSVSFNEGADESAGREITSTDLSTAWDHIWVRITYAGGTPTPTNARVGELVLYELK